MPSINHAINSTRKLVAKEVDKKLKIVTEAQKNEENLWRGKKIISTAQWEAWKRKKDFQYKLLDYIPEDFVEVHFVWSHKDEELEKMRSAWYEDYYAFLESKKNPSFGESKCRHCILHPWSSYCNESLRELILMGTNCDFPCKVLNMFECPYKQGDKDSDEILLFLKDTGQVISDALSYARNRSSDYDCTYEVDFEKCTVTTYFDRRLSGPNGWGDLRDLEHLELSKIPMRCIKDIHYVLSNSKALEIILEQYIKHVEEIEKKGERSDARIESKFLRKLKKPLIDHFASIKDKIKIEKLLNFEGKNLEEENEDKKRREKTEKWLVENEPQFNLDKARSGKCAQCRGFSNIHCINCDIWVCVDHWRKHGQDSHNMD